MTDGKWKVGDMLTDRDCLDYGMGIIVAIDVHMDFRSLKIQFTNRQRPVYRDRKDKKLRPFTKLEQVLK